MKRNLLLIVISLMTLFVQAQVGIGTKTPHASAMLEVSATNKGILIPRMTQSQRNAIKSPANSLMIYQTDNTPGYYYYASNSWTRIANGNSSGGASNTFTAPLTLTGTTVSIPQANASTNGFLSAADWSKFNKVENGTNTGDMLYWNGSSWVKLAAPPAESPLVFCDGLPTWGGCLAVLSTSSTTDITATTATAGGTLTKTGGTAILDKGIVWSTNANPTISLTTKKSFGSGSESFLGTITGLELSTVYYARAYATNSKGTSYGNEISFTTTAVDLTTGLVAYYPFNGNANDESGNGRNGTVNNVIYEQDRSNVPNYAARFSGSSWIDLPDLSIAGFSARSISFWIKYSNIANDQLSNTVFSFGSPQQSSAFNLRLHKGKFNLMGYNNDYENLNGTSFNPNIWYHVVVTYENNDLKFFLDGQLLESYQTNPILNTIGNYNYLGKSNHLGWEFYLDGFLDEFRIHSKILTPSEITYLATH